ncbi:MAG: hypothetical protein HYV47_02475 [Candidatus Nealsonbacteria bacterium]|nr:hypothetical protein [Candidatus Nealsonbacteria bacterium]
MINLLPPQQKKELLELEVRKLFLISGVLIILFLIVFSLALFSAKIYILGKVVPEDFLISPQFQDQEKEIMEINLRLQKLNSFYSEQLNFAELLKIISEILPNGIYLNDLSFAENFQKNGNFLVSLQGFSPTREILFQLKKNSESNKNFKKVDFPPASWVKPENIEFNVNFEIGL